MLKPSLLALASALALATAAHASVLKGDLWTVPEATAQNAVAASIPATPADVTFTVGNAFSFGQSTPPAYTVGDFLTSAGAGNVAENTPGTLARVMDDFNQGSLLRLTGSATVVTGQSIAINHDDGLSLSIGGWTDATLAGPHSPGVDTLTYTGPSGTYPVSLVYGECCGPPAVLQATLPASVPEPTRIGLAVVSLGLVAFVLTRRRRAPLA